MSLAFAAASKLNATHLRFPSYQLTQSKKDFFFDTFDNYIKKKKCYGCAQSKVINCTRLHLAVMNWFSILMSADLQILQQH